MSVTKLRLLSVAASAWVLSWPSLSSGAQEYVPTRDEAREQQVKAKWAAAEKLEGEHRYVAAAEQYAAVIAEEPLSTTSQEAAIRAGDALEKAGKASDAEPFYDQALLIADARASEKGSEADSLKRNRDRALRQWQACGTLAQSLGTAQEREARFQQYGALLEAGKSSAVRACRQAIVASHAAGSSKDLHLEGASSELQKLLATFNTTSDPPRLVEILIDKSRASNGPTDALADADYLLDGIKTRATPITLAKTKLMRAIALTWNRRNAEAVQAIEQLVDEYGQSGHPAIQHICADALGHAYAYSLLYLDDHPRGEAFLAKLQARHPNGEKESLIKMFQSIVDERTRKRLALNTGSVTSAPSR